MKRADVEKLEKIMGQFEGLHREISSLAKKSPNDGLNKFKLKYVNAAICDANKFLGKKYLPLQGFDQFDEDELPTNSDVTFILAAYLEEIERFRADNIKMDFGEWIYVLSDSRVEVRTAPPKKIGTKKS